jgi:hypothetical protein
MSPDERSSACSVPKFDGLTVAGVVDCTHLVAATARIAGRRKPPDAGEGEHKHHRDESKGIATSPHGRDCVHTFLLKHLIATGGPTAALNPREEFGKIVASINWRASITRDAAAPLHSRDRGALSIGCSCVRFVTQVHAQRNLFNLSDRAVGERHRVFARCGMASARGRGRCRIPVRPCIRPASAWSGGGV